MKFAVCRLERIVKMVLCEVGSYAGLDNALSDLGYNGQIGNWPVV